MVPMKILNTVLQKSVLIHFQANVFQSKSMDKKSVCKFCTEVLTCWIIPETYKYTLQEHQKTTTYFR